MYCLPSFEKKLYLPFAFDPVCAGFPSPATDHMDKKIDLNEFIVKHPAATFYVRTEGNSMLGAGIHSGDLLVVDRSLKAVNGSIIVAIVDGEFTVKRLCLKNNNIIFYHYVATKPWQEKCETDEPEYAASYQLWKIYANRYGLSY